jgi:hypothetical protein
MTKGRAMNHFTLPRRAAWTVLFALGVLAAVAGCAKKVTSVDAGYTTLEGRPDANARMLAWYDTPDTVLVYRDLGTPGPSPDPDAETDTLYERVATYATGPGIIHTLLIDKTPALGYQFYRYASNGGLQQLTDYTIAPSVKWLSSGWEMYSLTDASPSGYRPSTYVGRGLLEGKVTTNSPVTNLAIATGTSPSAATIKFTANTSPTDSLFQMSWTPAAGAAGYWIHIYQFQSSATLETRRSSGAPAPILDGGVKHVFVGYVDGSTTSYKLGQPGAEVLTFTAPIRGQSYYVRITAVDAHGNVIAWMHGDSQLHMLDGFYEYIPLGAVLVNPHR